MSKGTDWVSVCPFFLCFGAGLDELIALKDQAAQVSLVASSAGCDSRPVRLSEGFNRGVVLRFLERPDRAERHVRQKTGHPINGEQFQRLPITIYRDHKIWNVVFRKANSFENRGYVQIFVRWVHTGEYMSPRSGVIHPARDYEAALEILVMFMT